MHTVIHIKGNDVMKLMKKNDLRALVMICSIMCCSGAVVLIGDIICSSGIGFVAAHAKEVIPQTATVNTPASSGSPVAKTDAGSGDDMKSDYSKNIQKPAINASSAFDRTPQCYSLDYRKSDGNVYTVSFMTSKEVTSDLVNTEIALDNAVETPDIYDALTSQMGRDALSSIKDIVGHYDRYDLKDLKKIECHPTIIYGPLL